MNRYLEMLRQVFTIEFQKRGLPHAHILLFLENDDKIRTCSRVDEVISAEIPDKDQSPLLHNLVKKYMTHGPCGLYDENAPCMRDKKCSKYFPKNFSEQTVMDEEGYPTYRRRNSGNVVELEKATLDNRYIVPYNSTLLKRFQAHINVEKCNQSTSIKYLFKYISKGNDRVVAGLFDGSNNDSANLDEIKQYYDCRYISACEAAWRIFGFRIHHRNPSVVRLSFHLENQQPVIYTNNSDVSRLVQKQRVCESQFLAWMNINAIDDDARKLTYQEFPQKFVYIKSARKWKPRKKGIAIGRMTNVSASAGELFYLRVLLTQVKGPISYADIRTFEGHCFGSFREACYARGLLDDDCEFISAIKEGSTWSTGNYLRRLFASMLLCCCLQRPDHVWEMCSQYLSEDLLHIPRQNPLYSSIRFLPGQREEVALPEINDILKKNGKSLEDYPSLPQPSYSEDINCSNNLILQEFSYDREQLCMEAHDLVAKLNDDQKVIFDQVMSSLINDRSKRFFFVNGFGGTGKTFLWNALASTLRSKGKIVITVASSGIAATLLPSGRTAHSRFGIPIDVNEISTCSISQSSDLAELIRSTELIIWDEAPMVQRFCIEALDRSLKDIMRSHEPFGGKCIVMGGDFRQILPVIPKGTRAAIVHSCINASLLWLHCTIFNLTRNMRLTAATNLIEQEQLRWFSNWLLQVGDGILGNSLDGVAEIEIPEYLLAPEEGSPMESIVECTYPDLLTNLESNEYLNDRAILAPTIAVVNKLNDYMLSLLQGEVHTYSSCDSVCKSTQDNDVYADLHTTEFLNSLNSSGMPQHLLTLKVGAPIMLIRNIDQSQGLCNGTRLRVTRLGKTVIEAITLNGSHPNEKVLLHRMDMNPSENKWPFKMVRRQFPVILSFAMTINKSQGQSLRNVGIYLSKPVFMHGQLYVALSRVRSMQGLKIYIPTRSIEGKAKTTNVVYKEVFRNVFS